MIGYTITGYDVSRIKCTPEDVSNELLPTDVKAGSIAIAVDDSQTPPTETAYCFWDGAWVELSSD